MKKKLPSVIRGVVVLDDTGSVVRLRCTCGEEFTRKRSWVLQVLGNGSQMACKSCNKRAQKRRMFF